MLVEHERQIIWGGFEDGLSACPAANQVQQDVNPAKFVSNFVSGGSCIVWN